MASPNDNPSLFPSPSSPSAEVVTYIVRLLEAEEWEIRAESAKALGQRGDLRAVEALCIALSDRIWHVRIAAVGALGHLKDPRAVEPLCGALKETDWYIRLAVVVALGKIGDVRAVEPLCVMLEDTDAPVRSSAADALGQIGDVWAVEALCVALKDQEPGVRRSASMALNGMGTADTLPLRVLASMTMTPAKLLQTLESLAATTSRIPDGRMRYDLRYNLGNVPAFCEGLCRSADTEESVRRGAEAVLAELQHRADAGTLLRASGRDDGREKEELLRGVSGYSDPTPPDELLRASGTASDPPSQERSGLLARIFKRR